jgi:hypothetical protein
MHPLQSETKLTETLQVTFTSAEIKSSALRLRGALPATS